MKKEPAIHSRLLKKIKWRRRQDSNLQARKGGGFQDRCITNYATSPHNCNLKIYRIIKLLTNC